MMDHPNYSDDVRNGDRLPVIATRWGSTEGRMVEGVFAIVYREYHDAVVGIDVVDYDPRGLVVLPAILSLDTPEESEP